MSILRHIPNLLTCLNLLSGMIGIHIVMEEGPVFGYYFILAAAVFDFFDGFAARLLGVQSDIGQQLDSLADLVTFGVLPSFIVFYLIQASGVPAYLPYIGFLIGIQSAIRLAKFNVDERQTERFIGLPTPANALFFSTLPLLGQKVAFLSEIWNNPWVLSALTLIFSYLLTAELPLLALKFKHFGWKQNEFRYLMLLVSLAGIAIWGWAGIPIAVISYIFLSMISNRLEKHEGKT
ncbi:CDP-diacylglycerol---serine O-phosphatidyltransferase [Cyclobacterium xiamenense]|uniref:CDP-diacylglycerol--serine O-phosphatidyltransferase n=1 Tax=Cyclobacterium xiamenense TaxID=1297121 RepID=A0A1H7A905_9BACT|nr:CDP-diacylglycerol--serine O-phosphatidyltransferase [Cyclobacterium xiamenense]SEJ58552.1 CDP-diacylglycerol---serine O-phosphatidyltransferase [Cyclobacterium xiamenense]